MSASQDSPTDTQPSQNGRVIGPGKLTSRAKANGRIQKTPARQSSTASTNPLVSRSDSNASSGSGGNNNCGFDNSGLGLGTIPERIEFDGPWLKRTPSCASNEYCIQLPTIGETTVDDCDDVAKTLPRRTAARGSSVDEGRGQRVAANSDPPRRRYLPHQDAQLNNGYFHDDDDGDDDETIISSFIL